MRLNPYVFLVLIGTSILASTDPCLQYFSPLSNIPFKRFSETDSEPGQSVLFPVCSNQLSKCQEETELSVCRVTLEYEIIPGIIINEGADFQLPTLSLNILPNYFPTCSCTGYSHCKSFNQLESSPVWPICDDRRVDCSHSKKTCLTLSHQNVPSACQWSRKGGYCFIKSSTPTPKMVLYSKFYYNSNKTKQFFQIEVILGVYGSISSISIIDEGIHLNYSISKTTGRCSSTSPVILDTLPSGVYIELICFSSKNYLEARWEIKSIQETKPTTEVETPEGFCATGMVMEKIDSTNNQENILKCTNVDKQVAQALLKTTKPIGAESITNVKHIWCISNWKNIQSFKSSNDCSLYVYAQPINFLRTICSSLTFQGDPRTCLQNPNCATCTKESLDFPSKIKKRVTNGGSIDCKLLATQGFSRKQLKSFQIGLQIDHQGSVDGEWIPVFALLHSDIILCSNYLQEFTFASGGGPLLLNYGKYRIHQCKGFNSFENVKQLCERIDGINLKVNFHR